ncbi:MAG: cell division protein FtsZ [Verrucomicrobiales bacterium]|nr:cell division protein FtsZ [Verrucomicrobiales bacterium]
MIEYHQTEQGEFSDTSEFGVKVIGIGGAGANVLDRMALEGSDDAELLTLNTDIRALSTSVSSQKIQLGTTLLKGMGTGGDPTLGKQSAIEAVDEIRKAVRSSKMVFVCVGLGGGTGSGAAPEVCRIAREEGVFLVVFATMPFSFEGERRMGQAKSALDQIARYANAVITFDNDRMGELIVPKDGVAQAFAAADKIISQSIRATMNVVFRPGIIRIGMDDLLSALDADDSRCLFGYGVAKGDNRSHEALEQALKCPLLDRGKLLTDARSVLVQVAGGDTMTLFEVQLVMEEVAKHVGKQTQILFGTGTDKRLGNSLTVTIISSITGPAASSIRAAQEEEAAAPSISLGMPALAEIPEMTQPVSPFTSIPVSAPAVAYTPDPEPELEVGALAEENPIFESEPTNDSSVFEPLEDFEVPFAEDEPIVPAYAPDPVPPLHRAPVFQADPEDGSDLVNPIARAMGGTPEHGFGSPPQSSGNEVGRVEALTESSQKITLSRVFGSGGTGRIKTRDPLAPALDGPVLPTGRPSGMPHEELDSELTSLEARQQQEMLQLDPVAGRGRFAKTDPTIVDGEDLDVPTFLRKKK